MHESEVKSEYIYIYIPMAHRHRHRQADRHRQACIEYLLKIRKSGEHNERTSQKHTHIFIEIKSKILRPEAVIPSNDVCMHVYP